MARPTKFKEEFIEQVGNLALLGLIDTEMAAFFGVTERTFNNWKNSHDEFFQSLKEGRLPADGKVARKLYTEAIGGNITAMIFWLKNRQPARWRDKPVEEFDEELPESIPVIIQDATA